MNDNPVYQQMTVMNPAYEKAYAEWQGLEAEYDLQVNRALNGANNVWDINSARHAADGAKAGLSSIPQYIQAGG